MNFFESLISPFIYLIESTLNIAYGITENYGVSIILLSFIISLLLLPIFIYIEKSKKKDDVIKKIEYILMELSHNTLDLQGDQVVISCGYGIGVFPDDSNKIDELFEIADKRMYENKKAYKLSEQQ